MKKTAIVYDWIDKWGGVERLLEVLHAAYPQAPVYTSVYDPEGAPWARSWDIRTSFMQRLPGFVRRSRILSFPFYPYAFESFDFSGYDTVISVTSSFSKGIITRPETRHICYMLTPTRYLWVQPAEYARTGFRKTAVMTAAGRMREWDYIAAQRPDNILSLSQRVARRVHKFYGRESKVIYPPFDAVKWRTLADPSVTRDDVFLVVSRLEPYKKVDLVIETFNRLQDRRLVVVGKGSEEGRLKAAAGPNITFMKDLTDEELAVQYQTARAVIMMQEEDFGYVSLEAQSLGCPVITYRESAVTETIQPGKTGFLVEKQTPQALSDTLEIFHTISYNYRIPSENELKKSLAKFSREQFVRGIEEIVTNY